MSGEVVMREHTWIVEEIDGGPLGIGDFWKCSVCGASGGPTLFVEKHPPPRPFLAGEGIKLSLDCDEAAEQIKLHRGD